MPGIVTTWLPLVKLLLRKRRCSQVALREKEEEIAVDGGYAVQKGGNCAETPSCMLTQHGARTPGYPQAEGSGRKHMLRVEAGTHFAVSCPSLGLGGCLSSTTKRR